jgi:hypothetical protein
MRFKCANVGPLLAKEGAEITKIIVTKWPSALPHRMFHPRHTLCSILAILSGASYNTSELEIMYVESAKMRRKYIFRYLRSISSRDLQL